MECNKEEAIRAKDIAEKKMQNKDFVGARKIVLKAQQLYPDLENISQMLTVCEVHCSAGLKVNGETDWYGILQVEATADESLIKKQYRKLALLLHPDKNKFAGAEAAFKLIGEAHMTLSDRSKRSNHDMKRNGNIKTAQPKQPFQPSKKTSHARNNFSTASYNGSNQQQQQPSSAFTGAQTFWTICPFCGMRYQYYRSILNRALRCQSCMKPFIAYDLNAQAVPTGANSGHSWSNSGTQQQQFPGQPANDTRQHTRFGNSSSSGTRVGNVGGVSGINSEHGNGPANKAEEDEKVGVEAGKVKFEKVNLSEGNKSEQVPKPSVKTSQKRGRKVVEDSSDTDCTDSEDVVIEENGSGMQDAATTGSRYPRRSTRQKQNVTYNENESEDEDDLTNPASHKRLRKGGYSDGADQSDKDEDAEGVNIRMGGSNVAEDMVGNEQREGFPHVELANENEQQNQDKMHENKQKTTEEKEKSCSNNYSAVDSSSNASPNLNSFSYPDPEFSDFEKYRDANQFAVGQIWAIYDNLDGMPRFYGRIKHVATEDFKLHFTWLEHDPRDEVEKAWSYAELPVGCGSFKLGEVQTTQDRLMFSHVISWKRVKRRFEIYPRKGEVWALFKGWSITWSSDADNHRHYEYEVVEISSDFTPGIGIGVIPLVRIKGFVCLFMHAEDMGPAPSVIPASEILRFSHHIPSYRLNGTEREGVPAGCLELDAASLPVDYYNTFPSVQLDDCTIRDSKLDDGCTSFKPVAKTEKSGTSTVQVTESMRANNISSEGANVGSRKERASSSQHEDTEAWNHAKGKVEAPKVENDENSNGDSWEIDASKSAECGNSSSPTRSSTTYRYPEAEFHDFDQGKSVGKFQHGQIWALYSDIDKYPKYYGFIERVELERFEVHIQWLDPLEVSCRREEKRWIKDELPVGCGIFKVSTDCDTMIVNSNEIFSHLVQARQTIRRNQYEILPGIGEIWAVYKNWSIEWTLKEVQNCEYDVVQISEHAGSGLKVLLLTKVDGYRAVFRPGRNGNILTTMEIPRNEYLRFSHQIPAFKLTNERGGKLRGYWELDPGSVPEVFLFQDSN